jgi:outer membrane protein assembly factor BamB
LTLTRGISSLFFMRLGISLCTLLAVAAISSGEAPSSDWSRFRGPDGSGLGAALNPPANITASDFDWTIEIGGRTYLNEFVT